MKTITCDIWSLVGKVDAICIPTNGFVKNNGECVMGRGLALQAAKRYPSLARDLGFAIKRIGNNPHVILHDQSTAIVSFPVKPIYLSVNTKELDKFVVNHMVPTFTRSPSSKCIIPGWACKARLDIIELSARKLITLANDEKWVNVALPYVGCGAGELQAENVVPRLKEVFDERFTLVGLRPDD